MVVLVVGPSGIGKSDYGEHAAKSIPECQFYDLDSLVRKRTGTPVSQLLPKIGNDAFLHHCQQEVDTLLLSHIGAIAVIAVGAGALQSTHAQAWVSQHKGATVTVVATPEEVYERGGIRNQGRSLEEFISVEYSEARQAIYGTAKTICSVAGLTLEEARLRFATTIQSLTER